MMVPVPPGQRGPTMRAASRTTRSLFVALCDLAEGMVRPPNRLLMQAAEDGPEVDAGQAHCLGLVLEAFLSGIAELLPGGTAPGRGGATPGHCARITLLRGAGPGHVALRLEHDPGGAEAPCPLEAGLTMARVQFLTVRLGGTCEARDAGAPLCLQAGFAPAPRGGQAIQGHAAAALGGGRTTAARPAQWLAQQTDMARLRGLILASQAGDEAAYRLLLRGCASHAATACRCAGATHEEAQRAGAAVLLTVHRALRTYDPRQDFTRWLSDIVDMALRRARRRGPSRAPLGTSPPKRPRPAASEMSRRTRN